MPVLAQIQSTPTPDVEWSLLWPMMILGVGGVLLVTITSLVPGARSKGFPAAFTAVAAIIAGATLPFTYDRVTGDNPPEGVLGGSIVVDSFTIFITMVLCLAVALVAMLSDDYLRREGLDGPEWYVLLLLSAAGGVLLASANDLIVAFVGLEVLSIAVYVLAALHLRRTSSQEAGFKYFILGALSSAVFLYGIALIYGATGTTSIDAIGGTLNLPNAAGLQPNQESSMLLVGMALLLVGFGFKVSAAPFQMWTPDVYEGSPSPVVAFMASAVKVAGFAGFMRVFLIGFGDVAADWRPLLAGMAFLTLFLGAFLAIVQTNIKRMMAYSSITHAGFMLVGLYVAGGDDGARFAGGRSVLFYLVAYSLMVIGTFGVITVMGRRGDDLHSIASYRGLAKRQPIMAASFAVLLFAQSGVPFTSGFFAKFRVIAAVVESRNYLLGAAAMVAAAVGAYLYLRVVVAMFLDDAPGVAHALDAEAEEETSEDEAGGDVEETDDAALGFDLPIDVPPAALAVIVLTAFATVALGIFPGLGGDFLTNAAEAIVGR